MFHPVDGFDGVLHLVPDVYPDHRGSFHEWFKASSFEAEQGFPFDLQQANISHSTAGVVRGLHFCEAPPGQAKLVTCPAGRIYDVLVDIRVGSPGFGTWRGFELSAANHQGLYIPVGFAHGFVALEESAVVYLTTAEYQLDREHGIDPFDPDVGVEWPAVAGLDAGYVLSDKDRAAPALRSVRDEGLLPEFNECLAYLEELRVGWSAALDADDAAGRAADGDNPR